MTTARAEHYLLSRLGAGTTALLALLLDLPAVPAWCDGVDAAGRSVLLVGRHALGEGDEARVAVAAVVAALQAGEVPEGVHAVAYAPRASAGIADALAGVTASEILFDGPRGSGKTMMVPGLFAGLAELHVRAGGRLPLRVTWLHASLVDAGAKTGRSLVESGLWGGLWSLRDDRHVAVLTVAGVEMVVADFVGAQDVTAQERARGECHVVAVEELVPSLEESGGIEESRYELALSSARLLSPVTAARPRRRLAICTTNPGAPEHWAHRRWIEGGGYPGCLRIPIPAEDRLTPDEVTALHETFRSSPELAARLARGEWEGLRLGPQVAMGYNAMTHVAPGPLAIAQSDLLLGWDSAPNAHTHVVVIGAQIGAEIRVYAGLVGEETGLQQFLDATVLPWFARRAPWALRPGGERLLHRHDPAMNPEEGGDFEQNAVRRIRRALGGSFREHGDDSWLSRATPMLALLNMGNGRGGMALQIDPGEDTLLLRRALAGRWHYAVTRGGTVIRDLPAKPNHPWEDLGDSFAYFAGGVAPSRRAVNVSKLQKYAISRTSGPRRESGSMWR